MNAVPRTVLVTGCSSGIGRATALGLDAAGWTVFAGVRKQRDADAFASVASNRLLPLILDVTDADSIAAARARVEERTGGSLGAVVNNAGSAYPGPVEVLPVDDLRAQLEVNLIGHVAVTRELIPALRAGRGRIVNVTSIGGLLATPFMAPYHASKFGLEAVSDCLRLELRPWGIKTIVIEPGSVATKIWSDGTARFDQVREEMNPERERLYGGAIEAAKRASASTGGRGIEPEEVAKVIRRALQAKRPRTRYLVGRDAYVMRAGSRLLPDRAFDWLVGKGLRLP